MTNRQLAYLIAQREQGNTRQIQAYVRLLRDLRTPPVQLILDDLQSDELLPEYMGSDIDGLFI